MRENSNKVKQKKCKICRVEFSPFRPLQSVCSVECSISAAKEKEEKEWRKRKAEGLKSLKTLSQYEQDARKVFQQFIRLRDKDLPCISCGVLTAKQWDGGHYFKAELYSGLIFNEDNCHKQCSRCNRELHGNESNYRIGLVKKIGEQAVKWLEDFKDELRTRKYTKEELLEIKTLYNNKIKEL
jgi:hypothetical protein